MNRLCRSSRLALVVLGLLSTTFGSGIAGTGVSINPSVVAVNPDTVFTVAIWKDAPDLEFDGYQTVVVFDPEMLELVSAAEESVMTDACYNRWWFPDAGEDSIFISHVLMCGGITVTGPGAMSSLTFRALEEGTTTISCDYFWLTYQGYRIDDISWHDGVVNIGLGGIGPRPGHDADDLHIEAYPNPARIFSIRLSGGTPGEPRARTGTLEICDVQGRVVATLEEAAGVGRVDVFSWEGGRDDGGAAAPGVYFIKFTTPTGGARRKITLIR